MTKVKELHRKWMKEPAYKAEYVGLDEEFRVIQMLIGARKRAGLSQTELAKRMRTSHSYIARLESGEVRPTAHALERFARATGSRLKITLEPLPAGR
jgi:ribosome-binding protein aMBF1 (putative translation factor)